MRSCRCLVALLVCLWPCGVFAQARATGADITGTVRDTTGAVLPGSTVTAVNLETGVARDVTTDDKGHYVVPALPPGTYSVAAVTPGFATRRDDVTLTLGQSLVLDLEQAVAGFIDQEVVDAPLPALSPSRIEVGSDHAAADPVAADQRPELHRLRGADARGW